MSYNWTSLWRVEAPRGHFYMNYVIKGYQDTTEYPGFKSCPDTKTILAQFKYICKEEGLPTYKDLWDSFEKHIAITYSDLIEVFAEDDCAGLRCRLCGHYGCKTLFRASTLTVDPTYDLTPNCKIKLPQSVICGSECIGIPLKMRSLLSELKKHATCVRLINGRIDVESLVRSCQGNLDIYVPEGLCVYPWPTELYCTTGEFKWTDWSVLSVKKTRNGRLPKTWKVTTFTRPEITKNFDYMIRIKKYDR